MNDYSNFSTSSNRKERVKRSPRNSNIRRSKRRAKSSQYDDFDDETTKIDQKFRLLQEINQIKSDIDELNEIFEEQIIKQKIEQNKELRYQRKYKPELAAQIEEYTELPNRVLSLQDTINELEQQISFFSSLYSKENLQKIQQEVDEQKVDLTYLKSKIEDISLDSELTFTSPEWAEAEKRMHYLDVLKESEKHYKQEVKTLRKEGKELLQNFIENGKVQDPVEANQIELAQLETKLRALQNSEEMKKIELEKTKSDFEKKQMLLQSINGTPKRSSSKKTDTQKNPDNCEQVQDGDSSIFHITQNKNII